ncbi:MAG: hypothetical protein C4297_05030 [Gemmataceae bacterium]
MHSHWISSVLVHTSLGLAAAAWLPACAQEKGNDAPAVRTVTLAELTKAIQAHKGKVVVVDFWADG